MKRHQAGKSTLFPLAFNRVLNPEAWMLASAKISEVIITLVCPLGMKHLQWHRFLISTSELSF